MNDNNPAAGASESEEVREMAHRERARWLSVAEADRVRQEWERVKAVCDEACKRFDCDPENREEAVLFGVTMTIMSEVFYRDCVTAATKLRDITRREVPRGT
jgi:hypothetical protein